MREIAFDPAKPGAALDQLPARPAVFALYGAEAHAEPYIGRTPNLRARLARLLQPSARHPRRLQLAGRVRRICWRLTGSEFESLLAQFSLLEAIYGAKALERMHLRAPAFVRFLGGNPYPRITVTHRPSQREADWAYGPFPSRAAAERFADEALKLFLLRRCTDELDPNPSHPGCVYSEMKMCLAPCFRGCTDDEYRAEVVRVEDFLDSRGESLKRQMATERDEASAKMEFEAAAAIHARLDKLAPVLQQLPEFVRRIDQSHAVIVQKSRQAESVALFRVDGGALAGPLEFPISDAEHAKSQSMEARIQGALTAFPAFLPASAIERMEHLAILKRWCYRGTRAGEIFFADTRGELPMRRLVRGIGRVYKGEAPETSLVATPAGPVQSKEQEKP